MRRLLGTVAVAAMIAVTGCQATQKAAVGPVNASASTQNDSSVESAATAAPIAQNTTAPVGHALTITGDGGLAASVTVVSVKTATAGTGPLAEAPQNGVYVIADVLIEVTGGTYDFNPLYFHFQASDGTTYDGFDGNGMTAGFEPMLGSGTLAAGQRTRGVVVFDVPAPHGEIVLSEPLGAQLGGWTL